MRGRVISTTNRETQPLSTQDIPVGLIGCGRAANGYHIPALKKLSGVRLTALAEIDAARLADTGRHATVERQYTDYRQLLALPDIDAVAICTPTLLHIPIALDALAAGKHVFVEKPLGLSLADCEKLIAAAQRSDRKIMVGFVLRHHRLLAQARAAIALNVVGNVELIQAHWTTPGLFRSGVPDWRKQRSTGGGALIDFAVHHVDLWRWLLNAEIVDVTANSRSERSEDQTVTIMARMSNGTLATTTISEASVDSHEIHIFGHLGALHVSCYRFDGLHFEPIFAPSNSARHWLSEIETLARELPYGFSSRGQGGEYGQAFVHEWQHFVTCIRTGATPLVSLQDGLQATRALLAAAQSSELHRSVVVAEVADTLVSPEKPMRPSAALVRLPVDPPALSVITVTHDNFESLRLFFKFLATQTAAHRLEIIIVARSAAELDLDEAALAPFAGYRVVDAGGIGIRSSLFALGVPAASAPLVVFAEDHAFPDPNWAEILIAAHAEQWAAVSPSARNGNPYSALSWAEMLIGYGSWVNLQLPSHDPPFPWYHTCYKRDVLLPFGEELESLLVVESVLHDRLQAQGQQFLLEPKAVFRHVNMSRLLPTLMSLYHVNRVFGAYRSRSWSTGRRLLYMLGSPLIPLLRIWRILPALQRAALPWKETILTLWYLLLGLAVGVVGEFMGYAFSEGHSKTRLNEYEYNRWRNTRPSDWPLFAETLPHNELDEK